MQKGILFLVVATSLFGQDGFGEGVLKLLMRGFERNLRVIPLEPGQVNEVSFYVGPDRLETTLLLLVGFQDPSIELSVLLPDDTVVTQNNAASRSIAWEVSTGGFNELYACKDMAQWVSIDLPAPKTAGAYIIKARLPSNSNRTTLCVTRSSSLLGIEGVDYIVSEPTVKTDHEQYQVGDQVTISVPITLEAGLPQTKAEVEASVQYRNADFMITEEVARIRLSDPDGHGIYTGVFRPSKPSYYSVLATIAQAGREKYASGNFFVNPRDLRVLSGSIVNRPGFVEAIMRFEVFSPGLFEIQPTVRAVNGKTDNTWLRQTFAVGVHETRWRIDPGSIKALNLIGPLELVEVHVNKQNPASPSGRDSIGNWVSHAGTWSLK